MTIDYYGSLKFRWPIVKGKDPVTKKLVIIWLLLITKRRRESITQTVSQVDIDYIVCIRVLPYKQNIVLSFVGLAVWAYAPQPVIDCYIIVKVWLVLCFVTALYYFVV